MLAVVGKFSVRNPTHELRVAELAGDRFDYVALGHGLSGSLNFPRRVATAYLAAAVWRRHTQFVESMVGAVRDFGIQAPLYLLRADGGTQTAESFRNPAEGSLSGPAASVMGIQGLDDVDGDTLAVDVGGTTTDLSLFTRGCRCWSRGAPRWDPTAPRSDPSTPAPGRRRRQPRPPRPGGDHGWAPSAWERRRPWGASTPRPPTPWWSSAGPWETGPGPGSRWHL